MSAKQMTTSAKLNVLQKFKIIIYQFERNDVTKLI